MNFSLPTSARSLTRTWRRISQRHRGRTPTTLVLAVSLGVNGAAAGAQATAASAPGAAAQRPIRYGTGVWEADSLGNHRAVVQVDSAKEAVYAHIEWRRRDRDPAKVQLVVVDARTQLRVHNVARMQITREYGDIVFQPPTVPGAYYVYYLPYTGTFTSNYPKITYRPPDDRAERAWLLRHALTPDNARWRGYQQLPAARLVALEARDEMSKFTPMEYIAGRAELDSMRSRYAWAQYFLFAEDRALSIRMADDIPRRWAQAGPFQPFRGTAKRGEYFTFQVGVWADRMALDSVRLVAGELTRKGGGGRIPASAITCFNLAGTDWSGHRFTRTLRVERGKVQPLWLGIDVPRATEPGEYEGELAFSTASANPRPVKVILRVEPDTIVNHGDDDPRRMTRLRWLDSQIAAGDEVVSPYTPMRVAGRTVSVLGRSLTFGADGFPTSVMSYFAPEVTRVTATGREVLAAPVSLVVRTENGDTARWNGAPARVATSNAGAVEWEGHRTAGALSMDVAARMEFDGTTEFTVALRAKERTRLRDVRLEVPLRAEAAKYMMGFGQRGGYRPRSVRWVWDVAKKNQDAAWLGDVNAGLQLTLKDEHYVRPLNTNFYLSKPLVLPVSWGNGGLGGCDVQETGDGRVPAEGGRLETGEATRPARGSTLPSRRPRARPAAQATRSAAPARTPVSLSCYSGERTMEAGDSLRFDFRLMITPFRTLDTAGQWGTRYFHAFVPVDSVARRGANTINVHHANRVNPWINYPFLEPTQMKSYVDSAHAKGMKVKIYYTVRELTNHAPEIFALRSLGDEVLSGGPGGGYSWLQEHLGGDYLAAWHVPEIKDAAVVNSGVSRWHNFYVEGLDWLVRHVGIDGIYIDDVAFDRTTMKRVRRVLDRGHPGALIDLHSANQYNKNDGFASSANLYLEHFPFLDRLWFGEYFDYDSAPDYWLVEISGIPFGLMGEMLEKGGNPWRGMTFGMTNRMPWSGDPSPLWAAWDDFGIGQSRMIGWWSPAAPVTTGDSSVLATSYVRDGRTMVSLGSWAAADRRVRLTIDWAAIGIDPAHARLRAPAIAGFQDAADWQPNDAILVRAGKGALLVVERQM